jgi:hypothetical protein
VHDSEIIVALVDLSKFDTPLVVPHLSIPNFHDDLFIFITTVNIKFTLMTTACDKALSDPLDFFALSHNNHN